MTSSISSQPRSEEEFNDLGFGAEVARGTRQRLLNSDGSFNVIREGLDPLSSGQPFYRAFFFSVDSLATIGYRNIYPLGGAANTLVTIEALLNILHKDLAASDESSWFF